MNDNDFSGITRRTLLKTATGLAGVHALSRCALFAEAQDAYGGLPMGVQSWCFREFSLQDCLTKARELGLGHIEFCGRHIKPNTPKQKVAEIRAQALATGIQPNAFGVTGIGKNEPKTRKLFEFARALGVSAISADPRPGTFDLLDKLVAEYGINVAIHNHGPKHRYATDDIILKAIEGHDERIGACVDTGHFLRADVDPVAAVRKLGKRVHGIHLKDMKSKREVVVGQGDLDLVGLLRALREIAFSGYFSLEYESKPDDPIPGLRQCLSAVREAVEQLG